MSFRLATVSGKIFVLVPVLVSFGLNLPFNSVVASCDCGHVPLKLLDLATLVKSSNLHQEKKRDCDRKTFHQSELPKLLAEVRLGLNAGILYEKTGIIGQTTGSAAICI